MTIRHAEIGEGPALVHLTADGALAPVHALLSRRFRVAVLDVHDTDVTPAAVLDAVATRGIEAFGVLGSGNAARMALEVALAAPERVLGVVLESPTASASGANLTAMRVPTLVLCGTQDADAAAPRHCAALIPSAHLTFVYAAGPAIAADRAEAFVDVVGDFLEHREAFVISRATTLIHP